MAFIKWDCGCIGIKVPGYHFCIKACDSDDGRYDFSNRPDLAVKGYQALGNTELLDILDDLRALIRDGYKLRDLKECLK